MAIYGSRGDQVLLVFQDGRLLDHPMLTDDGKVKKVRWIPFAPGDDIPVDEIAILIAEAVALRIVTRYQGREPETAHGPHRPRGA